MSTDSPHAPAVTPALVAALLACEDTVIVHDSKTGAVSYKKLTAKQLDDPRWLVIATRDQAIAAAAAALTAAVELEWAA